MAHLRRRRHDRNSASTYAAMVLFGLASNALAAAEWTAAAISLASVLLLLALKP